MGRRSRKRAVDFSSEKSTAQPTTDASTTPPPHNAPRKRQKREEYRSHLAQNEADLPKKKWFRQRAHANPFSDHVLTYPIGPHEMDWSEHFPTFVEAEDTESGQPVQQKYNGANKGSENKPKMLKQVEVADIGCGFGGLLFALAPMMPDTLILGLEIRTSVTEFVQNKIRALRHQNSSTASPSDINPPPSSETTTERPAEPGTATYQNVSALRANTMKFLPNFFHQHQLSKIFLCFPDPHFKARKHKARIVSSTLTAEYAFVIRPGGIVYTITDVEDLHLWMCEKFDGCELFGRLGEEELEKDDCVSVMKQETEEGKKVERHAGNKFVACWRRLEDPPWPDEIAEGTQESKES